MKKTCLHIFTILTAVLSLLACTPELHPGEDAGGEGIVLDFLCVSPTTRAGMNGTKDGEDAWNENYINTLDVFFYTQSGTGNSILHKRFTPDNRSGKATVTVYTDDAVINTIIPDGNTSFWVYAVANYPGTLVANESDLSGTSIEDLKAKQLSCNFSTPLSEEYPHRQNSFVMDGLSQILSVDKEKRLVAKGSVDLKRVAAKITVQLNIAEGIEVEKTAIVNDVPVTYYERWEPMTSGEQSIQMYIENAVLNTTLAAKPVSNPTYFTYKNNKMYFTKSTADEDASYPWVTDPTYVYPQHWEYASKSSPTKEPTIKLILPWKRISRISNGIQVNYTQKQFYYKIIIPDDTRSDDGDDTFLRNFVRNNWYNFKMDVGMLGSETDDASVLVSGYYYVVDWQDKDVVEKQAAIGKARFLSISPKEHTIYNEDHLEMLYTSSHPVALNTTKNGTTLDITATKIYYGSKNAGSSHGGGTIRTAAAGNADYAQGQKYVEYNAAQRKALNSGQDWLKVEGDYVKLTHSLNNDFSAGDYFDAAPYIIRFNLYHADHSQDGLYKQSVKITQYPAMYITTKVSNGKVIVNNQVNTTDGTNSSSTSVNDNNNTNIGSIINPSLINDSGDNTNPRLYTVYVTVLPSDSDSYIGDPRTDGSSAIVTTLSGLNTSANYRPVAENTQDIIAPAIMIASSYGRTSALFYENTRTRCAAYQESGYPAGRWRLPTSAEIEFLVTLSEKGQIPSMFNPGASTSNLQASNGRSYSYYSYYWSGGGYGFYGNGFTRLTDMYPLVGSGNPDYTFNNQSYYSSTSVNGSNHHSGYTRCVYDIWYWGEEPDSSHLTSWGGYQTTK